MSGSKFARDSVFDHLRLAEVAAPSTPASGSAILYVKSDGRTYYKDDAGTEHKLAHVSELASAGDITDLATAETDTAKVLHPDGAGGVTWGTDATGGGGSTDLTIPAGGTLYDGTSTTGFSAFGGIDTFDADSTVPDHFYLLEASSGGNNIYGATHSVGGSFPRTYTARVDDALQVANYQGVGICFGDSGGKFVSWGTIYDGGDVYFQRYLWNSASSAGVNANYLNGGGLKQAFARPIWLRVIVNSTTDLDLQWSRGGYIWQEAATALDPSMTIDRFGLFVYGFGARAEGTVKWLHES